MVMIMAIFIKTNKMIGINKKWPWARMGSILWVDKELV